MRTVGLFVAALVLAAWLAPAPAAACMGCMGVPAYGPPVYAVPWAPQVVYVPSPYYYPPPGFYLGSDWDPDHRDIRYNRYFQRYQPPPQVRGYTLGP